MYWRNVRKLLDEGKLGNVGVLLRGTKREDVERGRPLHQDLTLTQNLAKYMFLVKKKVEDILLSLRYRPQFYRTTDVTGEVTLP